MKKTIVGSVAAVAAALGIVRSSDQNIRKTIRVLAFDPTLDKPDLLRTVVMLLRVTALGAATRKGADQLATAEEKIIEAIAQLEKLDEVKKTPGSIQKYAVKIESSCTGINSGIQRLLSDAQTALDEAAAGSAAGTVFGAVAYS